MGFLTGLFIGGGIVFFLMSGGMVFITRKFKKQQAKLKRELQQEE